MYLKYISFVNIGQCKLCILRVILDYNIFRSVVRWSDCGIFNINRNFVFGLTVFLLANKDLFVIDLVDYLWRYPLILN